ncbi:sulfoxide reductase heme-binding subunit yedZ [Alicycliphilus sp. B1]|nr:sulfoxide reductase heme-binding subunit yedZ [Alicycliphilus sp. B1]
MLGVYTFFYAALHLLCYAWFDMGLDGGEIARDVAKRPFILVGMCGFVLLLVLAATSFNRAVRWLGGRRWQRLHRSVYLVAGLALLHFFWMRAGKNDFAEVASMPPSWRRCCWPGRGFGAAAAQDHDCYVLCSR